MRRREFFFVSLAAALPVDAWAQQELRKIGFVSWFSPSLAAHVEQFRKGMRDLGYLEGRDIAVDAYFTDGDRDRTREVVRKLLQDKVQILVVEATPAIEVAKQEAGSLPIVMAAVSDPIAAGFAQSLSQPGGNLTGRTMFGPDLAGKRIEFLKELKAEISTVGFLGSSMDVNTTRFVQGTKVGTDQRGLKLVVQLVEGPKAIDAAVFAAMRRDGAEAVIVRPIFAGHQARVVALANEAKLPVVADWAIFAEAGAVLTYGIDDLAQMRRAAYFVDRIFKGASPGDLPVEQPTETWLAVNVAAAKRFGWIVPPSVIIRADQVID
jgi:putative tryptophan/tyrosine transport system substrate-binding protein